MEPHNQETWGKKVYLFSLTLICYKVIEMVWFYYSHIMDPSPLPPSLPPTENPLVGIQVSGHGKAGKKRSDPTLGSVRKPFFPCFGPVSEMAATSFRKC